MEVESNRRNVRIALCRRTEVERDFAGSAGCFLHPELSGKRMDGLAQSEGG